MLHKWIRQIRRQLSSTKGAEQTASHARFRPALEQLEDRLTPSSTALTYNAPAGALVRDVASGLLNTTDTSSNWAGYAITGSQVNAVGGTWVVPTASSSPANANSAVWVGIDGFNDSTVEQIGTTEQVVNGKASYNAWVEFFGDASAGGAKGPLYFETPIALTVNPGDTISAAVVFESSTSSTSSFLFEIKDVPANGGPTETWSQTLSTQYVVPQRASGEWIVEAPGGSNGEFTLANIGTVQFSQAWATVGTQTGAISAFNDVALQMNDPSGGTTSVPTSLVFSNSTGTFESGAGNSSFSVTTYPGSTATAPTITANPSNETVTAGNTASFTAAASNATNVQWQVSTNGGLSYTNLTNGNGYSGVNSDTLTVSGTTTSQNGYLYRAVFSNASNLTATTTAAELTVNAASSHSSAYAAAAYANAYNAYVYAYDAYVAGHGSYAAYVYAYDAYYYAYYANYYNSIGNAALREKYAAEAYQYGYYAWNYALADFNRTGSAYSSNAYTYGYTAWNDSYLTSIGE